MATFTLSFPEEPTD